MGGRWYIWSSVDPPSRDALEGKSPQWQPQRRLGRRLEEVAKAVGGGYCRLQMPLRLGLGVRWAKNSLRVWGAGHSVAGKLHFATDVPEHKWSGKEPAAPIAAKAWAKRAKPPNRGPKEVDIPVQNGEHVQEIKVKWSCSREVFPKPMKP